MTSPSPSPEAAWPLWDLFLEVPHPQASQAVNKPPAVLESPSKSAIEELLSSEAHSRIARFCFPEFNDQSPAPSPGELNRHDVYVTKGFQHHSFSLQLSTGDRVQGHVRRFLPNRVPERQDVGRRGVRALVILTRASGGDTLYAGMLK